MAGYSGTPLPRKLGIKPGARIALIGAPVGFEHSLGSLPERVELQRNLRGTRPFDVVLAFFDRARDLEHRFDALRRRMTPTAGLWIAWPKRASGLPTDLSDAAVRSFGLGQGLVDNKVCAVDETWSALRFVIRRRDR